VTRRGKSSDKESKGAVTRRGKSSDRKREGVVTRRGRERVVISRGKE